MSLSFGRPKSLRHQVPGELDRALLEVVAEREVAEHLEEGVVARRVADIVEVVVLAARAHAFLRRDGARIGALFQAGEDVLELHHPGIGEHQGRVVARDERRRGHDLVAVLGKIVEEARPDIVDAAHDAPPPAATRLNTGQVFVFSGGGRGSLGRRLRRPGQATQNASREPGPHDAQLQSIRQMRSRLSALAEGRASAG